MEHGFLYGWISCDNKSFGYTGILVYITLTASISLYTGRSLSLYLILNTRSPVHARRLFRLQWRERFFLIELLLWARHLAPILAGLTDTPWPPGYSLQPPVYGWKWEEALSAARLFFFFLGQGTTPPQVKVSTLRTRASVTGKDKPEGSGNPDKNKQNCHFNGDKSTWTGRMEFKVSGHVS
jgi:hypothetical protein